MVVVLVLGYLVLLSQLLVPPLPRVDLLSLHVTPLRRVVLALVSVLKYAPPWLDKVNFPHLLLDHRVEFTLHVQVVVLRHPDIVDGVSVHVLRIVLIPSGLGLENLELLLSVAQSLLLLQELPVLVFEVHVAARELAHLLELRVPCLPRSVPLLWLVDGVLGVSPSWVVFRVQVAVLLDVSVASAQELVPVPGIHLRVLVVSSKHSALPLLVKSHVEGVLLSAPAAHG